MIKPIVQDRKASIEKIRLYFLKAIAPGSYLDQPVINWEELNSLLNYLGIGIEPTFRFLANTTNSAEQFEQWVNENGSSNNQVNETREQEARTTIFTPEEMALWQEKGYIILRGAIPTEDCRATTKLIYAKIGADPSNPASWYLPHPLKQGIMIQLYKHELLERNRYAPRIRQAFQQLWKEEQLFVSHDRVSFNPPESANYTFPGPNLHWDVSLQQPIPFGLQGLLYLTDTAANQGAFTVIPGFHRLINDWLEQLPEGTNPRDKALLNNLEREPIAAKAGDLIIWHHCLPHGSSPNTSDQPRIVQYINYQPVDLPKQGKWL